MRILLVSSCAELTRRLEHVLSRLGHEGILVQDGGAALKALHTQPAVQVLVVGLAHAPAVAFLREAVRSLRGSVTRRIVLSEATGEATQDKWSELFEAGAHDVLGPPHDMGVLGERIIVAQLLHRRDVENTPIPLAEIFDTFFNRNPEPMLFYDLDTLSFLEVNAAAIAKYGYSREEFLARTVLDIRPPEDVPRVAAMIRNVAAGRPREVFWRHQKHDGTIIDVEIIRQELSFHGRPAVLVLARDTTDLHRVARSLRQGEQRYQRVVDHILDALMMDDVRGNVVYANRAFLELFGLAQSDLAELILEDYIAPEWRAILRDRHDRRIRGEVVPLVFEYVGIRKDGKRMELEVSVVEIMENGVRTGTQSVIRDVSARKELERRALRAQRMEVLGQLAGVIAHDFNNILMALTNYPELIGRSLADDHPAQAYVADLAGAIERASMLTHQLLGFSQEQVVQPRNIEVDRAIDSFIPMMRQLLGETIRLELTRVEGGIGRIHADSSQLEQIMLNLVLNGRDAMPGGGTISIEVEGATLTAEDARVLNLTEGDHVIVRVVDRGVGIPPNDLEQIFQPFFTTKPAGKGTGLGLASVLAAVQRVSGQVTVDSTLGQGTTFTLWFPVATDEDHEPDVAVPESGMTASITILVVEDDPVPRKVLEAILKSFGHTVVVAANAAEALAILADTTSSPIGLVISDLVMPGMSGSKLALRIKTTRPELPIVLVSGYAPGDLPQQVADLHLPFLEKPFSRAIIGQKLLQVLGSQDAAGG